jgi:hypothetical protein
MNPSALRTLMTPRSFELPKPRLAFRNSWVNFAGAPGRLDLLEDAADVPGSIHVDDLARHLPLLLFRHTYSCVIRVYVSNVITDE